MTGRNNINQTDLVFHVTSNKIIIELDFFKVKNTQNSTLNIQTCEVIIIYAKYIVLTYINFNKFLPIYNQFYQLGTSR